MRRLITVVAVGAAAIPAASAVAPTSAQDAVPAPATAPTPAAEAPKPALRNGCQKLYRQASHRWYAGKVYRRAKVTEKARARLKLFRTCAHSAKAGRKMRLVERKLKRKRQLRLAMLAITPYPGPNGTRWAIPYRIVACEGGWNGWSTLNHGGSGARGPYQFLGWPVPWPVRTTADRLAHHRMAAKLYAGGRGVSHWYASRHCWGG